MSLLQIGTTISLKVVNTNEEYILSDGKEKVSLPKEEVTEDLETGQWTEVFLFLEKDGSLSATKHIPDASLDTYGWSEVVEVINDLGVFVDIGIRKEILVSKDDLPLLQTVWPKEGDSLFVSLEVDKKGKLLAKPITEGDVQQDLVRAPDSLIKNQITGRIYRATKSGSFMLTEEGYRGFIHPNERKQEPRVGETVNGRVIDVKEDGTINVSLLPLKQEGMHEDAEMILAYLQQHGGEMDFTDKSDPEAIRSTFQISKAAFKRALGKLMKEKKISQTNDKTILTEE
ncbi:CvfB family protein [Sediminibacillus massiliensis]|uniref:CvfB family protein n=1 Tax=Sediminibacillus massiliensis TaxID=1926277 RepID=UPI0009884270|nr:S1-like domain-containing RNA-binding protein [Sediminibacillus massiliensis]